MPRVKIDYVVSFSSESPDAPASNLLANEAGRGRWLCAQGESSCSVLLQLAKAVQISSITIGAHHTALVEVLVGRSEKPNDPFEVLVASSVFLSPMECRRLASGDAGAERVRTFTSGQLADGVRARRWDRVRVVCSQPYNKHCKYGLSFIHIFSPEGEASDSDPSTTTTVSKPTAVPKLSFLEDQESDDDEFKPGALFAKHRAAAQAAEGSSSTDAQIRQATSQALKNVADSSTKLIRTPISKPKGDATTSERPSTDRRGDRLMYADEDDRPHDKIDRVVAAHKDQQLKTAEKAVKEDKQRYKEKEKASKQSKDKQEADSFRHKKDKEKLDTSSHSHSDRDKRRHDDSRESRDDSRTPNKRERSSSNKQGRDGEGSSKKQKVSKEQDTGQSLHAGPVSDSPHTLLSDVVFVLSGYENPRRAAVRDAALAMGARFQRDWGQDCTHLICAFPNTPKLRSVRASANGSSAIVVTAEWIERCAARQRRLPWQWFATEVKYKVHRTRNASGEDPPGVKDASPKPTADSECDTDDEIEKVLRAAPQKGRRDASPDRDKKPDKPVTNDQKKDDTMNTSHESDVTFVRDERIRGCVTVSDIDSDDTDKQDMDDTDLSISNISGVLPSFFEGLTFAIHDGSKPVLDVKLVRRYIRAYGGEIVEPHSDEETEVDYVVCLSACSDAAATRGRRVRGDWLWRCHERRKLCDVGEFVLA